MNTHNINSAVNMLTNIYISSASECVMLVNRSFRYIQSQPPWWGGLCDTLKSTKQRLLRQFRISNDNLDLTLYKTLAFK